MYRLTIIKSDGAVYYDDKVVLNLDLSFIPDDVGVLQWHDNGNKWIEKTDQRLENVQITELPTWATQAYDLAVANYV